MLFGQPAGIPTIPDNSLSATRYRREHTASHRGCDFFQLSISGSQRAKPPVPLATAIKLRAFRVPLSRLKPRQCSPYRSDPHHLSLSLSPQRHHIRATFLLDARSSKLFSVLKSPSHLAPPMVCLRTHAAGLRISRISSHTHTQITLLCIILSMRSNQIWS